MNRFFRCSKLLLVLTLLLAATGEAQDNQKLAQSGLEFLSVVSDARAGAMASAMTSLDFYSSSLFFNPAGMANQPTFLDASASYNQWIAEINHSTYSLALRPAGGAYGVFGICVHSVDYGEILGTVVADTDLGYEDTGEISASALAIGLGYAKALSDRFSVGGQVRWVRQSLGESTIPEGTGTVVIQNEVTPLAFDFGTLFKTGVKSLAFGMSVRNFSREIKYEQEGFQLPLLFTLGISMNVMDLLKPGESDQALLVSVDATHPRSHPEQLSLAVEYRPIALVSLRGGYTTNNDEDGPTVGFGISRFGFQLDYAYAPFGVFDNVQRVTARFAK